MSHLRAALYAVRVVEEESDNIVESPRERGVPVDYLVTDDESHGFANPESQVWLFPAIEHTSPNISAARATPRPRH